MDPEKKSLNFIFPTKYVIRKSLKFSHWPSKAKFMGGVPQLKVYTPDVQPWKLNGGFFELFRTSVRVGDSYHGNRTGDPGPKKLAGPNNKALSREINGFS